MATVKTVRKLKVYEDSRWKPGAPVIESVPGIKIRGKWLSDYGYKAGDQITLTLEDGEIRIKKISVNNTGI